MDIAGLCLPLKPQKEFNNPVSQVVQHIGTAFTDAKTLYDMIGHTGVTSHITVNSMDSERKRNWMGYRVTDRYRRTRWNRRMIVKVRMNS